MSRSDRIMVAAGGGALILALAAAWVLFAPVEGATPDELAAAGDGLSMASPAGSPVASAPAPEPSSLVVDVQGGVAEPGVRELPAGARVADAIAAAGGYATDADLAAAATAINLAQVLADGEQIRVPRVGDASAAVAGDPASSTVPGTGGGGGGLVNLNTATPKWPRPGRRLGQAAR